MTEREILQLQVRLGINEYLLVLTDGFYHTYGAGAFALARLMNYRVVRRQRPWGEVLTCGFPDLILGLVCLRIREAGGDVELIEDHLFLIHGLDGTPDEVLVWEPEDKSIATSSTAKELTISATVDWLADAVMSFNVDVATLDETMSFVRTLQQRLSQTTNCKRYQPLGQRLLAY